MALIIGLAEAQHLSIRESPKTSGKQESDLDLVLLQFSSFFSIVFNVFSIIAGTFSNEANNFKGLNVTTGVAYIALIILQITLIYNLKTKVARLRSTADYD